MTEQYYLVAQLPGLDGLDEKSSLPIHTKEFKEVCSRYLGKKSQQILEGLSLIPPRNGASTGSRLVDRWNQQERELRLALGSIRASNMKKQFDAGDTLIPSDLLQISRTAAGMEDPLQAEQYLLHYRLEMLGRLRPMDSFCEDAVYFYGLRLMLLERMQKFDRKKGIASYNEIYNSVLNRDHQER